MNQKLLRILLRDIKKSFNTRTLLIWGAMSAICIFFFFTTNGKTELIENNTVPFMAVMLPQIIFGAWAVLSVYFDLVSADREHNVLDLILCSDIRKSTVFLSKMLTIAILSLILSMIYLLPVTAVIVGIGGQTEYILLLPYILPLWGYIMVFASIGLVLSIAARSSKAAMIWSLAAGLILMPRFFMLIVEGLGAALHWTQATIDSAAMISPGVLMNALSDFTSPARQAEAAAGFTAFIAVCVVVSFLVFRKQDELNNGE